MPPLHTSLSTPVSAQPRAGNGIGAFLCLATAVLILTGCDLAWSSTPTANTPEVRSSELTDAGGQPCPQQLPSGDDPSGHGYGTAEGADELPTLLEPQAAWVCQYNTFGAGTPPSGGTTHGWSRAGRPEPVPAADL